MREGDSYYWAGGRKVPLEATSEVAIDLDSAAATGLDVTALARLRGAGRILTRSLLLVSGPEAADALGPGARAGVHPVFHSQDGSLVVVLPEVRVESADSRTLDEVGRSLTTAHVKERTEERLVLEPDSGRGEDALALANSVAESHRTDVSQPRLLRVVDRPSL